MAYKWPAALTTIGHYASWQPVQNIALTAVEVTAVKHVQTVGT